MKLVIAATLASSATATFVRTPGGLVHESCIINAEDAAAAFNASVVSCPFAAPAEERALEASARPTQIYAMDTHTQKATFWTNFTANWVVPKLPAAKNGQVVYFWPGFKSSKPEMGLPVLQPVMQYGQGLSRKWQLQSWFVHGGAVTAKAIALEPGDEVTSIMSYDAASTTWTISGTNVNSGESSVLTITRAKLGGYDFDWAMLVCETIKDTGQCDSLPADDAGLTFTNVTLDGNGLRFAPWIARHNLNDCNEAVTPNDAGDTVKMSWTYK
jgi:hypothetical protein